MYLQARNKQCSGAPGVDCQWMQNILICPEISGRGVARLLMVSGLLVFVWDVSVSRMDV